MNSNPKCGAFTKVALALMLLPLLNACGSDSDDVMPPTPPPTEVPDGDLSPELRKKFDLIVETETATEGTIKVFLGRWFPCSSLHPEMCSKDMPADFKLPEPGFDNVEAFETASKYNIRTMDDSKYYMEVDLKDLRAWREQSIREDIFVPGNYSLLDLMLYVSEQRDDFEVTLGDFNEARQSYDFTVSFDANGDGDFNDLATNYDEWGDYQNSDSWGVAMAHSGGAMLNDFNGYLETVYDRLDETLVRDTTDVRIHPVSKAFRDRVWQSHKDEVQFKKDNGGKVILKAITLDMEDTDGYGTDGNQAGIETIAEDIEVKAYNLRRDIYQEGVITSLDMVISANEAAKEAGSAEFGFTFWPTLYTGAKLGSYVMNEITHPGVGPSNTLRAEGLDGWNYSAGMNDYTLDIIVTQGGWPSAENFTNPQMAEQYNLNRECLWLREEDGSITTAKAQECIDHWYGTFGGNKLHVAMDNMVRNHGMEYVYFSWVKKMFLVYNVSQVNSVNEGRLAGDTYRFPAQVRGEDYIDIADINEAVAPLNDTHFGWNIADCALCHGINDIHVSEDAPVLDEEDKVKVKPYFCASCHGGNGAPFAHGETSRCFWCHSDDKAMKNHGQASKSMDFSEVECQGAPTLFRGPTNPGAHQEPFAEGTKGSCADKVPMQQVGKKTWDGKGYESLPAGRTRTLGNSDWHNTEDFPDPYSCVTCHITPEK